MNLTSFENMPSTSESARKYASTILRGIQHRRKSNPVKSKQIENALGISGTVVRDVVSSLRNQGIPIYSGSTGYYYDPEWSDMPKCIAHLKQRSRAMLRTVSALEQSMGSQNV